jgi:hypothetical protein
MFSSTLTHLDKLSKTTRFALCPKGNGLIFRLSPFRVGAKKGEKSNLRLICQSRISSLFIALKGDCSHVCRNTCGYYNIVLCNRK